MTQKERYQAAKEMYAAIGVDTDAAIAKLRQFQYPYIAGRVMM